MVNHINSPLSDCPWRGIYEVSIVQPNLLRKPDRHRFIELVRAGGEVNSRGLPRLVARALMLGICKVSGEIIGVGAIKVPNEPYRLKVFQSARASEAASQFEFELGWFYVDAAYRGCGIARNIAHGLTAALGASFAYATSQASNKQMHRILLEAGFVRLGDPYSSKENEGEIWLFVKR